MYNNADIIKQLGTRVLPFLAVIYLLLWLIPNKNILTINLIILAPLLVGKLTGAIYRREKPLLNDWVKTIVTTAATVSVFYFLYKWMGGYGIVGVAIMLLLFTAWRIWRSWGLFMHAIRTIELRLFGRNFDKEGFKSEKTNKKEISKAINGRE